MFNIKKRKILFVSGYSFLLESYSLRLRQNNFDVYSLEDANTNFVEKVAEIMPDLIYLYIVLPGRDGFKALGLLKADLRTKNIPIIFENRKSKAEDIEMGIRLGAIDYLVDEYTNTEIVARTAIDYFKDPSKYIARYSVFVEMLKAGHLDHKISEVVRGKMLERGIEMPIHAVRAESEDVFIMQSGNRPPKSKITNILILILIIVLMVLLKMYLVK
jgi:CheY-like chemotaxis protein